jgi:hypothetical protein
MKMTAETKIISGMVSIATITGITWNPQETDLAYLQKVRQQMPLLSKVDKNRLMITAKKLIRINRDCSKVYLMEADRLSSLIAKQTN